MSTALEAFEAAKAARDALAASLDNYGRVLAEAGVARALEAWPEGRPHATYTVPTDPDDGADVIVTVRFQPEGLPDRVLRFYVCLVDGPQRAQDFLDAVDGTAEDAKACVEVLREYGIRDAGVVGTSGLERAAPQAPGLARFVWVRRARAQSEKYLALAMEDVDNLRRGLSLLEGRR